MKPHDRIRRWSLGGAVALSVLVAPAYGQSSGTTPEKMNSWTGFLWLPGLNGTVGAKGLSVDLDLSVSDTWNIFKDKGDAAFSSHYERIAGTWTFMADLIFVRLEGSAQTRLGTIESKPETWVVEIAGARTVSRKALSKPGLMATTQLLVGVRYTGLKIEMENTTTGVGVDRDQDWFDPFLGARYFYDLDKRWTAQVRFDFGGFGVGSHFTWNLVPYLAYHLSKSNSVVMGWRILDQNYDHGSTSWDMQLSGPFLGFNTLF